MLTYGTLFSGIDGFAVAFDRLGWDLRWQVEQDEFCLDVLRHHWPDVPKHTDIRDVGAADLERVDVIAGGFPCQDLSGLGRGAGLDGASSGLWTEMLRVIRELRPRYVVVENVSALLARGLGRVLGDLAEIGFDAEWDCVPASAVGAPHRRDRLWIVAYLQGQPEREPADEADPVAVGGQAWHEPLDGGQLGGAHEGWFVDDATRRRHWPPAGEVRTRRDGPVGAGWWADEPDVARMAHGVSDGVDRRQALGNALVPQIPQWIGARILKWERGMKRLAATGVCTCCGREATTYRPLVATDKGYVCAHDDFCRAGTSAAKPTEETA